MAESFSIERRKTMRMLGAKVVLTPAAQKGTGMVKKVTSFAARCAQCIRSSVCVRVA